MYDLAFEQWEFVVETKDLIVAEARAVRRSVDRLLPPAVYVYSLLTLAMTLTELIWFSRAAFLISMVNRFSSRSKPVFSRSNSRIARVIMRLFSRITSLSGFVFQAFPMVLFSRSDILQNVWYKDRMNELAVWKTLWLVLSVWLLLENKSIHSWNDSSFFRLLGTALSSGCAGWFSTTSSAQTKSVEIGWVAGMYKTHFCWRKNDVAWYQILGALVSYIHTAHTP